MSKFTKLLTKIVATIFVIVLLVPSVQADASGDLYLTEIGIEPGDTKFYADVCATGITYDTVEINFIVDGIHKTLQINNPPQDECKRYYSWGTSYFQVEPGDTVNLTVMIDYFQDIEELDEDNNTLTKTVTIGEYGEGDGDDGDDDAVLPPVPDLYLSDIGVENGVFYTKLCGIDTSDLLRNYTGVKFEVAGQSEVVVVEIPESNTCNYVYMDIENNFNLAWDTYYTVTATVDSRDYINEASELNNTLSYGFRTPVDPSVIVVVTGDIYVTEVGMEDGDTYFYADVCLADVDPGTLTITFSANGVENELELYDLPSNGCKRYYSWEYGSFGLSEGDTTVVTVEVDSDYDVAELDETNNTMSATISIPVTEVTPTKDVYVSDTGTATNLDDLYAKVCGTATDGTEGMKLNFNVNNYNHTIDIVAPTDGTCTTYYSNGVAQFNLAAETTYTLTSTVDYDNELAETDESNNSLTYTFTTLPTNDDLLFRESLILVRIGDLDGGADGDAIATYNGALKTTDSSLVSVDFLMPFRTEEDTGLFDDTYTETAEGATWVSQVGGYWDGYLFYVQSESTDTSVVRSLEISVEGYLNELITATDDLRTYAIGDGTDNAVSIELVSYMDIYDAQTISNTINDETTLDEFTRTALGLDTPLFKDVSENSWYSGYVDKLQSKGIISGYGDTGEFGPENNVTVAELIKVVVKTAGYDESDKEADLSQANGHWAEGYVAKAEELGLTIVKDSSLDLNRPAIRGEVVEALIEAAGFKTQKYETSIFADQDEAGRFLSKVEYAQKTGIIEGYSDGTFGYNNSVNRAEMSKIVSNTIEVLDL